jgi:hypothetical protein
MKGRTTERPRRSPQRTRLECIFKFRIIEVGIPLVTAGKWIKKKAAAMPSDDGYHMQRGLGI